MTVLPGAVHPQSLAWCGRRWSAMWDETNVGSRSSVGSAEAESALIINTSSIGGGLSSVQADFSYLESFKRLPACVRALQN